MTLKKRSRWKVAKESWAKVSVASIYEHDRYCMSCPLAESRLRYLLEGHGVVLLQCSMESAEGSDKENVK